MSYPSCVTSLKASPAMSSHYVHVNTKSVIDALTKVGFHVASIKADTPSARDPKFVRHAVDFRLPGMTKAGDVVPRILFINSHNGRTKARTLKGMFRVICSNGLVVGTNFQTEEQRHAGDSARELIDRIQKSAAEFKPIIARIDQWRKIDLSRPKQLKLARIARDLRFGDKAEAYKVEDLLAVRRSQDERSDLWTIMNRVQENAMVGGIVGRNADNRQVSSRPLRGITSDMEFNQLLWDAAEEFA